MEILFLILTQLAQIATTTTPATRGEIHARKAEKARQQFNARSQSR